MPRDTDESVARPVPASGSPATLVDPDSQAGHASAKGPLESASRIADATALNDRDLDFWMATSPAARELQATIARAAPTDATVLIVGESGTGKEVTARALHRVSRRRGSFIPVNTAAIPRDLAESQLFGHERGAFTGAGAAYVGYCEAAHGGTLFLDEVTEMDLGLQATLLRFLEDQTVQRVGSTTPRRVDVRVVAATNRDPEQAVRDHLLRDDVYYRLNVISIRLAPLRERALEICRLANLFLAAASRRYRCQVRGFTPAALKLMEAYHWPGNIRELKNCVERMVILAGDEQIGMADLPNAILRNATGRDDAGECAPPALGQPSAGTLVRIEQQVILDELLKWDGNVLQTARSLGIARSTLYRKLKHIHQSPAGRRWLAAGDGI